MAGPVTTPHLHTCAVRSCTTALPNWQVLCRKHWLLIPVALRVEVAKASRLHARKELSTSDLDEVKNRATAAAEQACGKNATSLSRARSQRSKGGAYEAP